MAEDAKLLELHASAKGEVDAKLQCEMDAKNELQLQLDQEKENVKELSSKLEVEIISKQEAHQHLLDLQGKQVCP